MRHPKDKPPKEANGDVRSWLLRVGFQSGALLGTFLLGIVLVAVAQKIGWLASTSDSGGATASVAQSEETIYTCPMHPDIRVNEPGNCPICGMELVVAKSNKPAVPVKSSNYICPMMCTPPQSEPGKCPVCAMDLVEAASGGSRDENSVTIDPAARRILGIQTAVASSGPVTRTIRAVGRIDYDEERVATIAAYVDGRLEELFADYIGVSVNKGGNLALLYSPKLYSAQVEYLTSRSTPALDALVGDSESLANVARDNLKELGMSDEQIERLVKSSKAEKRLKITSPISGTVITKHKVEGDYVKTGEAIYRVADLSIVWLMLDLYPNEAAAVRFGQQVEAELQSLPGVVHTGRVAFVDPMVNETTRTVAVRVEMSNFDGKLKPGDYATAKIRIPVTQRDVIFDPALAGKWISPRHPQIVSNEPGNCPICGVDLIPTSELGYSEKPLSESDVVTVPRSAVLMAGDNSVLYVETKPGVFELRRVTVGHLTDQDAIILEGLEAGETVATEGNFLIDSQMQLSGNASLIDPGRATSETITPNPHAGHQH